MYESQSMLLDILIYIPDKYELLNLSGFLISLVISNE